MDITKFNFFILLEYTIEDVEKIYGIWAQKFNIDLKELLDKLNKYYDPDANNPIPFYILSKILSVVKKSFTTNDNIETILNDLEPVIKNLKVYHEYKNKPSKLKEVLKNKTNEFLNKFVKISSIAELKEFSNTIDSIKEKLNSTAVAKPSSSVDSEPQFQWETPTAKIYKLRSYEQDKKYIMGSKWCISNPKVYKSYTKYKNIFVIIPKEYKTNTLKDGTVVQEKYLLSLLKPEYVDKFIKAEIFVKDYYDNKEKYVSLLSNEINSNENQKDIMQYLETIKNFKIISNGATSDYDYAEVFNFLNKIKVNNKDELTDRFIKFLSRNPKIVDEIANNITGVYKYKPPKRAIADVLIKNFKIIFNDIKYNSSNDKVENLLMKLKPFNFFTLLMKTLVNIQKKSFMMNYYLIYIHI